jgi:DNA processing protein
MVDSLSEEPERDELRALLLLDRLTGVGPATLRTIVERFGSAVVALRASRTAFASVAGKQAADERSDRVLRDEVDRALRRADRLRMRVLTWTSPQYPERLRHLVDPPPVLFLRGRTELLAPRAVTIVGARRATVRARDVAERLGGALARAGLTVTSGLALGIDAAAHRGALTAGGDTVAVLGTGADRAYPRANARLFGRIVREGLVVSEFLPGTLALPHHFPRRNRILAALGAATVVVEAGARSGSLITVDHALDLGREVWVVPGPIERSTCAGSNALLLEGARPLLSVAHLVSELAPRSVGPGGASGGAGAAVVASHVPIATPHGPGPAPPHAPELAVDGWDAAVLAALAEGALSGDEVAERTGLPVHEALTRLTALELSGAVRQLPGMRYGSAA